LQPNPNVNAQAQPATVTVAVHNPSIRIRTHLWVLWARIAIRHEVMAQAARKEAQQPGVDLGPLFEAEMDASLTGICAAAFALEALSRELEELRLLPAATVGAWTKNRPSDAAVTLEVLKVAVDPKGVVNLWRQELPWLFKIRGESVHYEGSFQAPQPHPLGRTRGWPRSRTRSRTRPGRSTSWWGSWSGAGTSPSPGPDSGPRPRRGSSPS
jgi:hypothetical protein